jgi:hypothetical protein
MGSGFEACLGGVGEPLVEAAVWVIHYALILPAWSAPLGSAGALAGSLAGLAWAYLSPPAFPLAAGLRVLPATCLGALAGALLQRLAQWVKSEEPHSLASRAPAPHRSIVAAGTLGGIAGLTTGVFYGLRVAPLPSGAIRLSQEQIALLGMAWGFLGLIWGGALAALARRWGLGSGVME